MTITLGYSTLLLYEPGETAGNNIYGDNVNAAFEYHDEAIGREYAGGTILNPQNQDYMVIPNIRFDGSIRKVFFWTNAGTASCSAKIGLIPVVDSDVSATSAKDNNVPSSANEFIANNDLKITVASVSGVTELYWALWIDRNSTGTE